MNQAPDGLDGKIRESRAPLECNAFVQWPVRCKVLLVPAGVALDPSDLGGLRAEPCRPGRDRQFLDIMSNEAELIPTRWSLLTRLKDRQDHEGWKEFFDTYWKLIYAVALKSGLSDSEAQEVVQETIITVSKNIDGFRTEPNRGSFKAWLLNATRWRITDQIRKRRPHEVAARPAQAGDATPQTATVERMPDPAGVELDAVWDREWNKNLMDQALGRVKRQIKAKHYQIFHLNVLREMPARQVAKTLEVTVSLVYVVRLRVSRLVQKAYRKLEESSRDGGMCGS